jgi:F-type H+-transporting ATPase subunit b
MKKFLFGPIIKVMDVRKAMIDQQFAGAKEQEDQAKALKEQYEGALKSAREESFQIMEQARKEAKAQADKTVEDTQAKVSAMLAKAQEDINTERENAMRQMKDDVASLAMEAAGKIIGKNSGADQDLSLYDQFIEKAGDPDVQTLLPEPGQSGHQQVHIRPVQK